jgi:hypothetical protein
VSTLTQPHTAAFAQLWSEFSQGLAAAGQAIPQFAPDASASDLADGYQQFGMLLESAFRWYLRSGDPDFPRFVEINDTPELADNLFAPVRGDATYRLRGDVGSLFDFNISVHSEWGWVGPSQTSGDLGREELQINDDGTFELIISATEHPGNWLPLPPSAGYIQIREYYEDFGLQKPGSWDIMRVGSEGQAPPRAGIEDLKTKLDLALTWARNYTPWHYKTQSVQGRQQPHLVRLRAFQTGSRRSVDRRVRQARGAAVGHAVAAEPLVRKPGHAQPHDQPAERRDPRRCGRPGADGHRGERSRGPQLA